MKESEKTKLMIINSPIINLSLFYSHSIYIKLYIKRKEDNSWYSLKEKTIECETFIKWVLQNSWSHSR